jgi:hypothetical protein
MSAIPSTPIYPDLEQVCYLQHQEALFEQAKPELLKHYLGEFVAFEAGQVLDRDRNETELAQRVYRQHGYRDVLIKRVLAQEPQLSVGGAFTHTSEV